MVFAHRYQEKETSMRKPGQRFRPAIGLAFVAVAALAGGAAGAQQQGAAPDASTVPRITQEAFRPLHAEEQAYVVDVRVAVSYVTGRIPGAVNVPLDEMLGRADEVIALAGDRPIVTYCSCPSEHSAAEAGLILLARGAKDVRALVGGYVAWVRGGGKIER
jgi:rhodanese-related sulfurtransferase